MIIDNEKIYIEKEKKKFDSEYGHLNYEEHNKNLIDGVETYIQDSQSINTKKAYKDDWRAFERYCKWSKAKALPADYPTVSKYLVFLADQQKRKISTIKRKLAAIISRHRETLHTIDRKHKDIRSVLEGIKRTYGEKTEKSRPLSLDEIKLIIDTIDKNSNNSSNLRDHRDKTLILIGFLGGFRRSELINLEYRDIERDLEGLKITIRKSKTDQRGTGIHKKGILKSQIGPKYCPVVNFENWLKFSGISSGKIFRQIDNSNKVLDDLSDRAVAKILQWRAKRAGLDPIKLAGHSMRSGIATVLAKKGATETDIKKITGHRSNQMVQSYIQDAELFDNATKDLDL